MVATTTRTLLDRYQTEFAGSRHRAEAARRLLPSGITHDLRYLEPFPIYIDRAVGCRKWDVDGHELIDYWSGHGALLLGHSHPAVVAAVREQVGRSTHAGGCHDLEVEWARRVNRLVPSAEVVRFTASGTEATLMALRLARIATGRPKYLKFVGHFHGWHDYAMPAAYQPYDTSAVPGVPTDVSDLVTLIQPNDLAAVEQALASDDQIGAVILEPTGGHWGKVPIRGLFLNGLRELTTKYARLLIFDEVITGFRVAPGGAQAHYGITPDLTTLAKILAGGLPGGALAGRADLLAPIAFRPGQVKMRHPGTFNANPLSAAAGVAALSEVADDRPSDQANRMATRLRIGLNTLFARAGFDWVAYGDFSLVHLLPYYAGTRPDGDDFIPLDGSVDQLDGPKDGRLAHALRRALLLNGVDTPGLGLFLTAAHTESDIDETIAAFGSALAALRAERLV